MTSKAKTPTTKTDAGKSAPLSATKSAATTTKKAATPVKAAVKPAPVQADLKAAVVKAPAAAAPVVVDAPQAVVSGPVMRKRELIDLVVEKSGIKKKDAKPVIEAMLSVLGEAVADNRELNLQPFGKIKVRRAKEMPNGRVLVTKIRQSRPKLPEAAE